MALLPRRNFDDHPPQPQYQTYSCELHRNDAHYGYDCPLQVPCVYNQDPCFNQDFDNIFPQTSPSFPQQYLCCENCGGPHATFQCQPMNQNFYNSNLSILTKFNPRREIFEIKHAQPEDIHELLRKLLEDLQIINEELAEYINSPSWNCPTFYDDNDDEYSIQYREYLENSSNAITPDLPNEEPDKSLSMGDEHLSTISEIKSDEVIKSSVENLVPIPSESEGIFGDTCDVAFCDNSPPLDVLNDHFEPFSDFNDDCTLSDDDSFVDIDYVEATPPDSKLISLEEVKDDIIREKLLNINLLIAKIECLNDNPSSDYVLKSPSPFPNPVEDNDSFFEKSDTSHSYLDNSLPEFKTFSDHTEETSSGSTTTHADNSLPEYDSFLFEIKPDQGELTSIVI
uniref:Reverse transcriptase domain-containing protein n=1 Tax=Tanacetum cinerariifolium TaxID=118510 RepID=A0A699GNT2_TANCI|nr:hypothetical protein [Tanacetum cinerariifolium]